MTCNSIFMKVWLILTKLFMYFIIVPIPEFFFLFNNFRAYFGHFAQSKSTFFINWKLFSRFETARISIFIEVLLILVELFMIFITVLIPEFFFFRFITSERILATLVKVNRLSLLIEFCSAGSKLPGSQFS